jgi:hypothetical protein
MTDLITKIRYILNDNSTSGSDIFTYSSSKIFTLTESNVISVTDVQRNDVTSGVTHSYNATTNKVTISSSLTSGDIIQIDYTYYPNYSNSEILKYIQNALVQLSINNYGYFEYDTTTDDIYPTLSNREENLVATVTALLIEPDNRTIRLPDITIGIPSDVPTNIKIAKTISTFKHDSSGIFDILA